MKIRQMYSCRSEARKYFSSIKTHFLGGDLMFGHQSVGCLQPLLLWLSVHIHLISSAEPEPEQKHTDCICV